MPGSPGWPGSLAARVTYLLEPKNWLIVTVIGVGAHADGWAGAGWGLLAAFFAAVLPTVFISYGIRRGRWEDRNVGDRGPRLVVLAFIIASVATGLIGAGPHCPAGGGRQRPRRGGGTPRLRGPRGLAGAGSYGIHVVSAGRTGGGRWPCLCACALGRWVGLACGAEA